MVNDLVFCIVVTNGIRRTMINGVPVKWVSTINVMHMHQIKLVHAFYRLISVPLVTPMLKCSTIEL